MSNASQTPQEGQLRASGALKNGPPDMPPGELLASLLMMPRPYKIMPFPRLDPMTKEKIGDVAIWPLTQSELLRARAAADAYTKGILRDKAIQGEVNTGYDAIYKDAVTVELLVQALRQPTDLKSPAFPTAKLLRDNVTANECAVLVRLYLQVEREVGPLVDLMTDEECDAWLMRLALEGSRVPLALLSSEQLEDLVMHSAFRLQKYREASGSSGAPQAPGSPSSAVPDGPPPIDRDEPPAPAEVEKTPVPDTTL